MKNFIFRKSRHWISFMLMLLFMFCQCAWAAEVTTPPEGDSEKPTDKAVMLGTYLIDEQPHQGTRFRMYRIADYTEDFNFVWTDEYAEYNITIPDFGAPAEISSFTDTLSAYISRDSKQFYKEAISDAEGKVLAEDLDLGMYLVMGDEFETPQLIYRPVPFIVFFPYLTEDAHLSNDVELSIKYTESPNPAPPVDRHVIKVWDDAGANNRPESVSIDLLKDGLVYDSVQLNASNNWRFTWEQLDGKSEWQCVESGVAGGYTTSTSQQGLTYVVTNTRRVSTPPSDPTPSTRPSNPPDPIVDPDSPSILIPEGIPVLAEKPNLPDEPPAPVVDPDNPEDLPAETNPVVPDHPPVVETPEPTESLPRLINIDDPGVPTTTIPQTGQLSWPVPVLALIGVLLVLSGVLDYHKGRKV